MVDGRSRCVGPSGYKGGYKVMKSLRQENELAKIDVDKFASPQQRAIYLCVYSLTALDGLSASSITEPSVRSVPRQQTKLEGWRMKMANDADWCRSRTSQFPISSSKATMRSPLDGSGL